MKFKSKKQQAAYSLIYNGQSARQGRSGEIYLVSQDEVIVIGTRGRVYRYSVGGL